MSTIIALRGVGNSGKTSTIRILHELLIPSFRLISTTYNPMGGDFHSIFEINGKRLGITTAGDSYDLVHGRLAIMINEGCNDCVCACRSYDRDGHGTNFAIFEFDSFAHQFIEKEVNRDGSTQLRINTNDARRILTAISSL